MKYYIVEGKTESGKYNAGSKARKDVEKIMQDNGYSMLDVETVYGVRYKKWQKPLQYCNYLSNYLRWKRNIKKLKSGDIVLFQYPLLNMTFFIKKIIKSLQKKNVHTIAIIHDLDSLRLKNENRISLFDKRRIYEDEKVLPEFSKIISHNKKMTKVLNGLGINNEKIVNLEIFDYLVDDKLKIKKRNIKLPLIIAGNLSSIKAGYISKLNSIKETNFNLYGKGLDVELNKNVNYKGSFLPDDLPNELDGSFGLVWDGNSIDECNGIYGEYLKYNNPHKLSLYLISNLPVIVWKKSAMAEFVEKNKIGFAVNSLNDINKEISKISNDEYNKILKNVNEVSTKLLKGHFLKLAIKNVEEDL